MLIDYSPVRTKRVVDKAAVLSRAGPNSPSGVERPWGGLATLPNSGLPIKSNPMAAVGGGHAWLQMVGSLPLGVVTDNYNGANDSVTDGILTAWLLNPRRWGRRGAVVRRPRCLLIANANPGFVFRDAIIAQIAPFTAANIDVIQASGEAANHQICPLLGAIPIASSAAVQIGSLRTGPETQPAVGFVGVTATSSSLFEGGQIYVANIGSQRMEFGRLNAFRCFPSAPPSGTVGAFVAGSIHQGYTFYVLSGWEAGDDPGSQGFSGCTEVGSHFYPDMSVVGQEAARVQVFLNGDKASADRAALAAWATRFDRIRVAFWGNEGFSTNGGTGFSTDPADLNPGDPVATATAIGGGLGFSSYHALPGNPFTSDIAAAASAAAIMNDALAFFS